MKRVPSEVTTLELAVGLGLQLGHFLAEMKRGVEGFRLFDQAIDQLLRPADGQRRDVVNRFVGIQLSALAAHLGERIDDRGADAEQPQLENLEQAHGAGADDQRLHGVGGRFERFRHDEDVSPSVVRIRGKIAAEL